MIVDLDNPTKKNRPLTRRIFVTNFWNRSRKKLNENPTKKINLQKDTVEREADPEVVQRTIEIVTITKDATTGTDPIDVATMIEGKFIF